jgi:integrase
MDALRLKMIALGWSDGTVRKHMSRVRSLFAWGQERGLVPDGIRLIARRGLGVKGAPTGRKAARKRPPDPFAVGAVQLVACPPVRAMIWLQWLNGIRPGGVCALRPCDVDRSGELWVYAEPEGLAAKTGREIHTLGPRAQAVLRPWLDAAARANAPVFRAPGARTREGYLVGHYRDYVAKLCRRLGVGHWSPHALRHAHATRVRKLYGIEAARARLGHADVKTTEIYAAADRGVVERVAREIG